MSTNILRVNNYFQESHVDQSIIFFCNDTDIGILRQPVDGNPYKNVAVLGSGTKVCLFHGFVNLRLRIKIFFDFR